MRPEDTELAGAKRPPDDEKGFDDASHETAAWTPKKVLETGLRVHEKMKEYPWDRIALTIPQARAVLKALSTVSETPPKPRGAYALLTEEQIETWRNHWRNAPKFTDDVIDNTEQDELERLCNMAVNSLLFSKEIDRLRASTPSATPLNTDERAELERLRSQPYYWAQNNGAVLEDSDRYRWFRDDCDRERQEEIIEAAEGKAHMLDHHIDKGRCGL